jgi:hypothetical protein
MEMWLFIENNFSIDYGMFNSFLKKRNELPDKPVAVLVDSTGGIAEAGYRLSMLFRRRCGSFTAVVPRFCPKTLDSAQKLVGTIWDRVASLFLPVFPLADRLGRLR